jgi:hypothetical protein
LASWDWKLSTPARSLQGDPLVSNSECTPPAAAPFRPGDAMSLARELQPYLNRWHLGRNGGLPGGCVPPVLGLNDQEGEEWRRRTFRETMLASPNGERPYSLTYVNHDGPSWTDRRRTSTPEIDPDETLPPSASEPLDVEEPLPADSDAEPAGPPPLGRMYRNPVNYLNRVMTLWLLRRFHQGLQSHKDDPAWLDLTEAFRRLLDRPAWHVREPNERDFMVVNGWVAVGRQVEPCLIEDLVNAANLLVQVAGRGHTDDAPPSGLSPQEPTPANTPPTPKPDGLFMPGGFRWQGDEVEDLSKSEMKLLALLWADGTTPPLRIPALAKGYAGDKLLRDEVGAMMQRYYELTDKLETAKVAQIIRKNDTLQLVRMQATTGQQSGNK